MAEKEGFEPSIPFWGIHDFQSCALGQLRDFSIELLRNQPEYRTTLLRVCQALISIFADIPQGKSGVFSTPDNLTYLTLRKTTAVRLGR